MKVSFKSSVSLISLLVLASIQSSLFAAVANDDVVYTWIESGKLEEERQVFLKAFKKIYQPLTKEELPIDNVEVFLNKVFDSEVEDLNSKTTKVHFLSAVKNGKVVGFASFNLEGNDAIYLRLMSVDPDYARQGIGKALVFKAREVLPQARKYVLMTRLVNTTAIGFYKALGFAQTTYLHDGLDPKRYVGYEYMIPPKQR